MRSANKTVYIESNYSQNRTQFQPYTPHLNQPPMLVQSRLSTQRESQKTESPQKNYISEKALNYINQQLYSIVNMDSRTVDIDLRKAAKTVHDLIDNQLLLNIKNFSSMKLLMYNSILMYVEEFSQHEIDKKQFRQRQKSLSRNSSKNGLTLKQQDVALQNYSPYGNLKQLQNLKHTIPFVPKDKSRVQKHSRVDLFDEQLSSKIQSTQQSLESILKKIQHYSNYKLSGEDIMRLKKSVVNVSEIKNSHLLNLCTLNSPPFNGKNSQVENSRPHSREGKQGNSSMSRNGSKSKTYNGNIPLKETINSSSANSRLSEMVQDQEGNKLLIQQMEQIIQRKENRIKQLTKELSKNLEDQKQLENTISNFQIEINQIQGQRKNFHLIIEKLQEENLNYQLQIKELRDSQILRNQADKLATSNYDDLSQYQIIKQFEMKQKALKFIVQKQVELTVQSTPNIQGQSTQKNPNSLSGAMAFHDISQITPKRLCKKLLLPADIEESYMMQNNVITTRKNITPDAKSKQKRHDKSLSQYQIIGNNKTQNKNKRQLDSYGSRQELRDSEKENYQKLLFLQALTIEQMLQDI